MNMELNFKIKDITHENDPKKIGHIASLSDLKVLTNYFNIC